jgi:hypothetical protein
MPFPNPLLRRFVEIATEKSFDKGLFWGVFTGVMVTHFYKEDKYKKLESKYYGVKHRLHLQQLTEHSHARAEVHRGAKAS